MKIETVRAGDWIEAKSTLAPAIKKGKVFKVIFVDTDGTILIELEEGPYQTWWVDPSDFCKGKPKKVLTGSELCEVMIKSGSKIIMCAVSDASEQQAMQLKILQIVDGRAADGQFTTDSGESWEYVVPLNNNSEPLTSSDVGL